VNGTKGVEMRRLEMIFHFREHMKIYQYAMQSRNSGTEGHCIKNVTFGIIEIGTGFHYIIHIHENETFNGPRVGHSCNRPNTSKK